MGDYRGKLAGASEGVLDPGESLLFGFRAMPKGGMKAVAAGSAAGVVGGAIGGAIAGKVAGKAHEEGKAQAEAAGFPYAPQMSIGVTARRLIVWERSALTNKPKKVLGEIPLERVSSATTEKGKAGLTLLAVGLDDGSRVELEVPRPDKGSAEQFAGSVG